MLFHGGQKLKKRFLKIIIQVSHLLVDWRSSRYARFYEKAIAFLKKVAMPDCLSMLHFMPYLPVFRGGKIPAIFSILLDQGIDGVPEYPQAAFSNFRGFQTIFFNPAVDGPAADI